MGQSLFKLQQGEFLGTPHARAMTRVAPGMFELRVAGHDGAYRAFYYMASELGILVFHAFAKKGQQTAPAEIETGRRRLKEMLDVEN